MSELIERDCLNIKSDFETPETDAVYPPDIIDREYLIHGNSWGWGTLIKMREVARRLERERDEQKKYNAQLTAAYLEAAGELQKESYALREENRKLRDALDECMNTIGDLDANMEYASFVAKTHELLNP